ncbi:MAG: hypothetical protein ACE15B_16180 [Bryobacteraceae bacterium]
MIRIAIALLAAVVPLAAADFWEEKKFHEWSDKQVKRMLEDSPWARPVAVRAEGGGGMRRGGGGRGGGVDMSDASESAGRSRGGGRNAEPPEAPPSITVYVRWHTALPIRQAVARMRFKDEVQTSAEAKKMLERKEERYVVGVAGLPAQVVGRAAADIKDRVRLRLKNKPEIPAQQVEIDRQQGRVNLYCFFPKGQGGAPVIEAADGEVEVLLQLQQKISRKFKLKDMMYEGKLEM